MVASDYSRLVPSCIFGGKFKKYLNNLPQILRTIKNLGSNALNDALTDTFGTTNRSGGPDEKVQK